MKNKLEIPKTREFFNGSCFRLIDNKNYTKEVHINNNKASLIWKVNNLPMFGSKYYPLNNLPNFILRNLKNEN
jgi:hypothetical protein